MNLRRRFIVLVFGTTIMPVLVVALTVLVVRTSAPQPFGTARAALRWLAEDVPALLAAEDSGAIAESAPTGLSFAVLPLGNVPVAETLPESNSPGAALKALVDGAVSHDQESVHSLWVPVRAADGRLYAVAFRIGEGASALSLAPQIGIAAMVLALLLFSGTMSVLVIRHLRNGMGALEQATRRIAAGNYEFSVELEGSDELADLARAFDHMRATIREDQERSARFIMGISHDLKSPIGLIQGYAEAILDGHAQNPQTLAHFAGVIKDRAGLLEARLRELIDLARLSTEDWRKQISPHRILPFLDELVGRYRADAGLFGHELHAQVRVAANAWAVFDPRLIGRAMENLLTNSFRYAPEGSTVVLDARQVAAAPEAGGQPAVRVSITNPTERDFSGEAEHLFEPFWRASSSRNEPGSGLGLSITRSIIASHGFHLSAHAPERTQPEDKPSLEMRIVIPLTTE